MLFLIIKLISHVICIRVLEYIEKNHWVPWKNDAFGELSGAIARRNRVGRSTTEREADEAFEQSEMLTLEVKVGLNSGRWWLRSNWSRDDSSDADIDCAFFKSAASHHITSYHITSIISEKNTHTRSYKQ